jgi:hypothetical protein
MPRVDGTPEDGTVRPVIDIEIHAPGKAAVPIRALVDSGADFAMIPIQIGEAIAGRPFDQIGPIAGHSVGLGGTPVPYRVLPGATMIYAGRTFATTVTVGQVPRVVVGQSDFLSRFDVRFYWGHNPKYLQIEPTQPATVRPISQPRPANPTIRPKKKRP